MQYLQAGLYSYFEHNFFQSVFQVTQKCNFSCPYCVNQEERKEKQVMPLETMQTALNYIAKLDRPRFSFAISGGETTLYPHLDTMLNTISTLFKNRNASIVILTNGSASAKRMKEIISLCPDNNCFFPITIHFGQTNIEKLIEKLLSFSEEERRKHFGIKIVAPPQDPQVKEACTLFDNAKLTYGIRPVIDFETGKLENGYTNTELDKFEPPYTIKDYFQIYHKLMQAEQTVSFLEGIRKDMYHYKNMYCSAGYHSIYITEDGSISKGQFCNKMSYTIMEKNPFEDTLFTEPQKCKEEHCTCTPYTSLPKWLDTHTHTHTSPNIYKPSYIN